MKIGKLKKVELRTIWESEPRGFTPWLAREDNIMLLGDTIGIDLELVAQEKDVGLFSADILCKDTLDESFVLIENQLDRTNHTHLGQLLTYAAGLEAVIIVWIARRFSEEHRAALDWLNSITSEKFNFFGLEIELWQIGDSAVAPKFNVVCKPNYWSRAIKEGTSIDRRPLTESKRLQFDFWSAFKAFADENAKLIKTRAPKARHSIQSPIGRTGFLLAAVASLWDSKTKSYERHELRAELVIQGKKAKSYYALLKKDKANIKAELGESLIWADPIDAMRCRIYFRKDTDISFRESWLESHSWLLSKLEDLHRVFAPRIKELK